ncbi:hypothetical protein QJS66_22840 [Kocuria rhizophila]|nr:hypothetical protein QJS66_22840 [Kocuria rhizophila]
MPSTMRDRSGQPARRDEAGYDKVRTCSGDRLQLIGRATSGGSGRLARWYVGVPRRRQPVRDAARRRRGG